MPISPIQQALFELTITTGRINSDFAKIESDLSLMMAPLIVADMRTLAADVGLALSTVEYILGVLTAPLQAEEKKSAPESS